MRDPRRHGDCLLVYLSSRGGKGHERPLQSHRTRCESELSAASFSETTLYPTLTFALTAVALETAFTASPLT